MKLHKRPGRFPVPSFHVTAAREAALSTQGRRCWRWIANPGILVYAALMFGSASPAWADYTLRTLASFDESNGSHPLAGLLADSGGNLYGTTEDGGAYGNGTVFELSPSFLSQAHTLSTLVSFNGANGAFPQAALILDASGNLYGTTQNGGTNNYGTIYQISTPTHSFTALASIDGVTVGTNPNGLLEDARGNLYGTTQGGGPDGTGSVFVVSAGTHSVASVAIFDRNEFGDTSHSLAALVADPVGNLYGTTTDYNPSRFDHSTLFEVSAASHTLSILATFAENDQKISGLVTDTNGNLYGTTQFGGLNNCGTIFEFSAASHAVTTLASFDGANGYAPLGGLILDASGNLYGTTQLGGADRDGNVYELNAATGTITSLASFNGRNGSTPIDGLIADANGNLYGTTWHGGINNDGTIFEVSVPEPASWFILGVAACGMLLLRGRRSVPPLGACRR